MWANTRGKGIVPRNFDDQKTSENTADYIPPVFFSAGEGDTNTRSDIISLLVNSLKYYAAIQTSSLANSGTTMEGRAEPVQNM